MKHRHVQRLAIAGLALTTFGLAACGDDNSSSSDTTAAVEEVAEAVLEARS